MGAILLPHVENPAMSQIIHPLSLSSFAAVQLPAFSSRIHRRTQEMRWMENTWLPRGIPCWECAWRSCHAAS